MTFLRSVSPDEYLNLIYGEAAKSINKEIAEGNNRYSFDVLTAKMARLQLSRSSNLKNFI